MTNLDELEAALGSSFSLARNRALDLIAELRAARRCLEAARSVLSEDIVKDAACCLAMNVELAIRLEAYDALTGERTAGKAK